MIQVTSLFKKKLAGFHFGRHCRLQKKKNGTNELTYKTEIESQM